MNTHQIHMPQAIRPIPTLGRGCVGCPLLPIGKVINLLNYSSKLSQGVNQQLLLQSHPLFKMNNLNDMQYQALLGNQKGKLLTHFFQNAYSQQKPNSSLEEERLVH